MCCLVENSYSRLNRYFYQSKRQDNLHISNEFQILLSVDGMSQETKEDNDKKSDEILEEASFLVENGRYSETLILLSQVIPKIVDDSRRSRALDLYNSAKVEIKRKYEAHQNEGIRTLKHGIRLIRSNKFKEANQRIQQSMNIFSRITWNLGTVLAKGALLINRREQAEFNKRREILPQDVMREEERIFKTEGKIIGLILDGLNNIIDRKYDDGIMLYKRTLPLFDRMQMDQKSEIEGIYKHVKDLVDSWDEQSFEQSDLYIAKLFLD
jgi:hypothetical protein